MSILQALRFIQQCKMHRAHDSPKSIWVTPLLTLIQYQGTQNFSKAIPPPPPPPPNIKLIDLYYNYVCDAVCQPKLLTWASLSCLTMHKKYLKKSLVSYTKITIDLNSAAKLCKKEFDTIHWMQLMLFTLLWHETYIYIYIYIKSHCSPVVWCIP